MKQHDGRELGGKSRMQMRGCACGCDNTLSLTAGGLEPAPVRGGRGGGGRHRTWYGTWYNSGGSQAFAQGADQSPTGSTFTTICRRRPTFRPR